MKEVGVWKGVLGEEHLESVFRREDWTSYLPANLGDPARAGGLPVAWYFSAVAAAWHLVLTEATAETESLDPDTGQRPDADAHTARWCEAEVVAEAGTVLGAVVDVEEGSVDSEVVYFAILALEEATASNGDRDSMDPPLVDRRAAGAEGRKVSAVEQVHQGKQDHTIQRAVGPEPGDSGQAVTTSGAKDRYEAA